MGHPPAAGEGRRAAGGRGAGQRHAQHDAAALLDAHVAAQQRGRSRATPTRGSRSEKRSNGRCGAIRKPGRVGVMPARRIASITIHVGCSVIWPS